MQPDIPQDIKILHIESTNVCQAACPLCARETDPEFDATDHRYLRPQELVHDILGVDFVRRLEKMFMCGNYGDPAASAFTLPIFSEFRNINPNIVLGMNTNGALQNRSWWKDLAAILNQPQDYVVFSIDGLEDTNHIYRRNVNWQRLMQNVESFVSHGGRAHWDMLVYEHNEHQVQQCEALARDLGFTWFRVKISRRPSQVHWLRPPKSWHAPAVTPGTIACKALQERSVYIDAQGVVHPCCWLDRTRIKDFTAVKQSWTSAQPNATCLRTCGQDNNTDAFSNQWQYSVAFGN